MKTFDQIFGHKILPNSEYLIYIDGDEVRMDRDKGKCGVCDNLTQFYSISFMGRYCSPKCLNEEWKRYDAHRENTMSGWIGVDLDGTLAHYEGWDGGKIGKPIPAMMDRVKDWIQRGKEVKIFTARASDHNQIQAVKLWLQQNGLPDLEVTNVKDFAMIELWDDRAVQVIPNTGQALQDNTIVVNDLRRVK